MLVRSSALVAADIFVRGVPAELPPLTEPLGVDVDVPVDCPFALADPFAAFSANRFCLDAEGGIVWWGEERGAVIVRICCDFKKKLAYSKCLTPPTNI